MKIILTQEVSDLGGAGDVVEVKDGYGRNYLLPRGYAIRWTRGAESEVAQIRRAREVREIRDRQHADAVAAELAELDVVHTARAGKGGRLFGSVTPADIVKAVKAAGGPPIDRRRLQLPGPVKTTGHHTIRVRLHPDVLGEFALRVLPGK